MFDILGSSPRVLIQGITGKQGSFHTDAMLAAGTQIVAGVVPGGKDKLIHGVPVYDTIAAALDHSDIDISIIFVPAPFCKGALLEAINARIPLIICITEGLPVHDFLTVKKLATGNGVRILGPNCPGILMPGVGKFGIIPESIGIPGNVSIVSRSGTLAYEVTNALKEAGIGQRIVMGIGGDPIKGTTFADCLRDLQHDDGTERIVLVGEIGGREEQLAAEYMIKQSVTKPIYAYTAGHYAPINQQLGHAGAIIKSGSETAAAKTKILRDAGAITANSVDDLVKLVVGDTTLR